MKAEVHATLETLSNGTQLIRWSCEAAKMLFVPKDQRQTMFVIGQSGELEARHFGWRVFPPAVEVPFSEPDLLGELDRACRTVIDLPPTVIVLTFENGQRAFVALPNVKALVDAALARGDAAEARRLLPAHYSPALGTGNIEFLLR